MCAYWKMVVEGLDIPDSWVPLMQISLTLKANSHSSQKVILHMLKYFAFGALWLALVALLPLLASL